jgi:sec-independent protein translocase protein TatC
MQLIFAFGLCFQMPVLLTLLTRVGIITSDTLKQKRRYAIVIVFIVAAIVTPPDPISQCTLAFPLLVLYEASVWLSVMVERNRDKREKEERERREKELSGDDPNIQKRSTAAPV